MTELAIDGGAAVRTRPLPSWPVFAQDEQDAVLAVLRSGRANAWTGDQVAALGEDFSGFLDVPHALPLMNGSIALEAALRALGIGPDDEVVVPARSFVATASCVVQVGARPVFADVDEDSGNISAVNLAAALTPATRAVIAVHLGGWPCAMDELAALCRERELYLVEDCAQALGATRGGRQVGSLGDVAAFSFCQDKLISSGGEGGLLACKDADLAERVWSLRDHGKSRTLVEAPAVPGFRWLHTGFGSNWRMTEMQAAIARIQLTKLPAWLQARRRNLVCLRAELAEVSALRFPVPPAAAGHAGYRAYCYVRPERLRGGWNRDRILAALIAEGVPGWSGSCPEIYREQAFVDAGLAPGERLPVARELGETSIALPLHPGLRQSDLADLSEAVRKVMRVAAN